MTEYIIWESDKTETTDYLGVKHGVSHFEKREEIVRCRDCKHYTDDEFEYRHYCNEWCGQVEPDDFCAWALERK